MAFFMAQLSYSTTHAGGGTTVRAFYGQGGEKKAFGNLIQVAFEKQKLKNIPG